MLRDAEKIITLKQGTLPRNHGSAQIMLNRNDRQFSKRVYTDQDPYTGECKPYMRSSINLAFEGGNYFDVKKRIKKADLKVILDASDK